MKRQYIYITTIAVLNAVIIGMIIYINSIYQGELISQRYNVYEGVTLIEEAYQVWQYSAVSLGISILNLGIWYFCIKYLSKVNLSRVLLTDWLLGSTNLLLILIGYYLWLIIRINA